MDGPQKTLQLIPYFCSVFCVLFVVQTFRVLVPNKSLSLALTRGVCAQSFNAAAFVAWCLESRLRDG